MATEASLEDEAHGGDASRPRVGGIYVQNGIEILTTPCEVDTVMFCIAAGASSWFRQTCRQSRRQR